MISTVAVWATKSALTDPSETVADMLEAGVNHCSLMLNDYRPDKPEAPFRIHDRAKVIALADACHDAGIEFSLTSWIKPYRKFILDAAAVLLPLFKDTRASLMIWDAEEVWVRAPGAMSHDGAASLVAEQFGATPMGVTGIVNANTKALRGLAAVCKTWLPQCYATINEGSMDPNRAVSSGIATWRQRFGEPDRWIIGLAGYSLPPDPAAFMRPPLDQARAAGVDAVAYWSHGQVFRRESVMEVIAGIRAAPSGSIMPVLDIASMPSGDRVQAVASVQGLLTAWGFDPGPIDGKPGAKTLAAVQAFQRSNGIAPSGMLDGATWWALLRA